MPAVPEETAIVHTLRLSAADRPPPRTLVHLSWAQLQRFADDFDLGRLVQMDKPLTTQCNTTDPFRTGQGTFMLRARHSEEFGARVEYLHALIDGIRAQGFAAPEVMRSKQGRTWTLWGERVVEIHRFVAHDPGIHRDWRRMFSAASALGDLHRALAHAAAGRTPVPPEMRNDVPPEQCWTLLQEAEISLPDLAMDAGASAMNQADAAKVVRRARGMVEPLLKDYHRHVGRLPWMTVHGDYHFWNVLYRGDEIAAVVDYDFIQERERLFDIAYALQNVVAHLRSVHGATPDGISALTPAELPWANVRMWVDHYDAAAHLPLTEAERRWLPREILRVYLVGVATGFLQEDPIESILRQGADLELYEWIGGREELFL